MKPFATAFFFLISIAAVVGANSAGAPEGAAKNGCTCHGSPATGTTVALAGLPESVNASQQLVLDVTVTGPAPLPVVGQNQGGFQLFADAGTLAPSDPALAQVLADTSLTHTAAGNDVRTWRLTWQAPNASANVTFWLAGNAVNGDATPDRDAWNSAVFNTRVVQSSNPPSPSPSSPVPSASPSIGIAAAVIALGAATIVAARLRRAS